MKKKLLIFGAAAVMAFSLAACGSSSSDTADEETTVAEETTEEEADETAEAADETAEAADESSASDVESSLIGTWEWTKVIMEEGGTELTVAEYGASQGLGEDETGALTTAYSFVDGGTVAMASGLTADTIYEGTYTVDGDTVTVSVNGTDVIFTYDSATDTLTSDYANGYASVFERSV